MSRKISDYFKMGPNLEINSKVETNHKVKAEFEKSCNNISNLSEIHDHHKTISNIKEEAIEKDNIESSQSIKHESDQEFIIELPTARKPQNPVKTKTLKSKNSNKFKCRNCNQKFKTQEDLKIHKTDCKCPCNICGKKISEKANLFRHIREIHSNQLKGSVSSCKICGKKYFQNSSLILHMKTKHPDGQFIKYECDFDGKLFKTRSELYQHMFTHRSRVQCQICDAKLRIGSVLSHMKDMHSEHPEEKCQICQKSFSGFENLKIHLRIHDKKFQCKICNKKLSTFPNLRDHIRDIHEHPGSHSCEICNKKFNRFENLKVHLKFHDKNRPNPFKCQRCDFATHSKANFNGHQKSHENKDKIVATMKNPLKCQKCPALLRNKVSLHHHMKYVHPEKLYQCDLCGKSAKSKHNILNHIKLHIKTVYSK